MSIENVVLELECSRQEKPARIKMALALPRLNFYTTLTVQFHIKAHILHADHDQLSYLGRQELYRLALQPLHSQLDPALAQGLPYVATVAPSSCRQLLFNPMFFDPLSSSNPEK